MMKLDQDRLQAAQLLTDMLLPYRNTNAVVVAIPNNGVPTAYHIADALNLELEIIPCLKIKHPALGGESIGSVCIDEISMKDDTRNIPQDYIYHQVILLQHALKAKSNFLRGKRPAVVLTDRPVILIDDSVQSGDTMMACLKSIKRQKPESISIAVPVVSPYVAKQLAKEVNRFFCLSLNKVNTPRNSGFVTDEEVKTLLNKSVTSNTSA
jgi:putative phosphoribosyl transferase